MASYLSKMAATMVGSRQHHIVQILGLLHNSSDVQIFLVFTVITYLTLVVFLPNISE